MSCGRRVGYLQSDTPALMVWYGNRWDVWSGSGLARWLEGLGTRWTGKNCTTTPNSHGMAVWRGCRRRGYNFHLGRVHLQLQWASGQTGCRQGERRRSSPGRAPVVPVLLFLLLSVYCLCALCFSPPRGKPGAVAEVPTTCGCWRRRRLGLLLAVLDVGSFVVNQARRRTRAATVPRRMRVLLVVGERTMRKVRGLWAMADR